MKNKIRNDYRLMSIMLCCILFIIAVFSINGGSITSGLTDNTVEIPSRLWLSILIFWFILIEVFSFLPKPFTYMPIMPISIIPNILIYGYKRLNKSHPKIISKLESVGMLLAKGLLGVLLIVCIFAPFIFIGVGIWRVIINDIFQGWFLVCCGALIIAGWIGVYIHDKKKREA